jgi:hypothetical protein
MGTVIAAAMRRERILHPRQFLKKTKPEEFDSAILGGGTRRS